jgi:hypothetical protein
MTTWTISKLERTSIRVRLRALQEFEYGGEGMRSCPSLKVSAADMATKSALFPKESSFLRSLVGRPALAGDCLHGPNMDPAKMQF